MRTWLVSSALENVESRVWTAQTAITCATGRWNTLLHASWYRVDSRLVLTRDRMTILFVFH